MPINILIADDHEVVRQGLRTILKAKPEWQICAEAENGKEAVEYVAGLKPDLVILDVTMPTMSGLEAAEEIAKLGLNTRVLIFTMHDSGSLAKAVRKAGARGIVLKSRAARDLIRAIEAILGGGTFWGPGVAAEAEDPKSEGWNMLLFRGLRVTGRAEFAATVS
jgi:DNA-binding NarL/FixJ family response regulator